MTEAALNYATAPAPSRAPRVWAALIIMLTGLGLIILGGCFLIGIMFMNTANAASSPPVPLSAGQVLLQCILYALAAAAFAGAIILFILGIRWLRLVVFS